MKLQQAKQPEPGVVLRALPGRGATAPGRPAYRGDRSAASSADALPLAEVPAGLQAQIDEARQAEAAARAGAEAAERARGEALAARLWDKLPELDEQLLAARREHATAAGQLAGLEAAAQHIAESMAHEAEAAAAERRRADAVHAEGRALEAEREAAAALADRERDFWALLLATQQAFADMRDLEQQVQRQRQARNDARAVVHGEPVPVRAQRPNRTDVLREGRPGVRELLELRP